MADNANNSEPRRGHDLNLPLIVTIGVIAVVMVFGVIIPGLLAVVYNMKDRHVEERVFRAEYTELRAHEADQYERITGRPRWINEAEGVVGISIDDAMKLYAERVSDAGDEARP